MAPNHSHRDRIAELDAEELELRALVKDTRWGKFVDHTTLEGITAVNLTNCNLHAISVEAILAALEVTNRTEAVLALVEQGLVPPPRTGR